MEGIRPERTIERCSRGLELIRRILAFWQDVEALPRLPWSNEINGYPKNREIKVRIEQIIADFGLTVDEWHYWCRAATEAKR